MLELLYPISFIVAFAGLVSWTSWPGDKSWSGLSKYLCGIGMVMWFISIAFTTAEIEDKLWVVFRDLSVMGIASILVSWTRSNRMITLLLFLGMGFFIKVSYLPILHETFQNNDPVLDPSAEWIAEITDNKLKQATALLAENDISFETAFIPQNPEITELDNIYELDVPAMSQRRMIKIKEDLISSNLFEWLEENEIIQVSPLEGRTSQNTELDALTNDPDLAKLWAFESCKAGELYNTLSSALVVPKNIALIAILDTGVDGNHEDLKDNYLSTNSAYDRDIKGHGTHCAGIIGAVSNNRLGIASFAPDQSFFKITSIKVLSDFGFGSQTSTIRGMIEAADIGADVISMSLGAPSTDERQRAYQEATDYCRKKGAIVVVAAGNANTNAGNYSPANTPGVIAVSAITESLTKASFSNTLEDITYPIAAPGQNIYSTYPQDKYRTMSGTSMATPYVASLLGIMKSLDPELTVERAHSIMKGTGITSGNAEQTGQIIQPAAAIRSLLD